MSLTGLLLLIFLGAAAFFLLGPREQLKHQVVKPELPDNLEEMLRESESRLQDIRPGLEKKIVWVDPVNKVRTPLSLIYLHGFSASRVELSPVPEEAARILGANLFLTRLSGHGRTGEALGGTGAEEWFRDALEALSIGKRLGEKVVLVGTSTGSTLACWLALYHPDASLHAMIHVSPNLGLNDARRFLVHLPWSRQLVKLVVGRERRWEPRNAAQAHGWTYRYPSGVGLSVLKMVHDVTREDFTKIRVPSLFVYSPADKTVSPKRIDHFYSQLGTERKKKVLITDSSDPENHVIAGDIISPKTNERVISEIVEFVRTLN